MSVQVIDIADTGRLAAAMRSGAAFRIKSGETIYSAYNEQEDLAAAEKELTELLTAGDNCRVYLSREEFWAGVEE